MKTLRIHYKPDDSLNFDLPDILAECTEYKDRSWLLWDVLWSGKHDCLDAGEDFFSTQCVQAVKTARNNQLVMTFNELERCASCVLQSEEGLFIALKPHDYET